MAEVEYNSEGHRERLRRRAEDNYMALKPAEKLELLLFNAVPRVDVAPVAQRLLHTFGSVEGVLHASGDALRAVQGVTPRMVEWILRTSDVVRLYDGVRTGVYGRIGRFRDVVNCLAPIWQSVPAPQCRVLYADFDYQLISHRVVCESLGWMEGDYPRSIVQDALALEARYVCLVMFVGRLPLKADDRDREGLLEISRTLRAVGVELLDCVMVGEEGYYSMNAGGDMQALRPEAGASRLFERYCEDDEEDEA